MQQDDHMHVLLKGAGDWSRSMCELAGPPLELSIEGPYGKPLRCASDRELLLIAGGVGISPFIDLLANLQVLGLTRKNITLVWAVRGHEFGGLSRALNVQSFSRTADVSIFITSQEEAEISLFHGVSITWDNAVRPALERSSPGWEQGLSSSLIILAAILSCMLKEHIVSSSRSTISSLADYALLFRACPSFSTVVIVVISGLGLPSVNKLLKHCLCSTSRLVEHETRELSTRFAVPAQHQCQIHYTRPDLPNIIQKVAELGPVEVQACGPERMLQCVARSVCLLRRQGLDVLMDSLESAL
jgi:hypothetical protein